MKTIEKISVRFFLNKNVKPSHIPLLGDSDFYPLYVQVTFRRKNTQFRSLYQRQYLNIEEAFNRERNNLNYEKNIIQQVVEFEVKTKGERFKLIGLKDRYKNYTAEVSFLVYKYLRFSMLASLKQSNSEYWMIIDPTLNWEVPIRLYYNASLKLINNFETFLPTNFKKDINTAEEFIRWSEKKKLNPLLIQWLNGSLKVEYKTVLQKKGKSKSQINEKLNFITKTIEFSEDNELV